MRVVVREAARRDLLRLLDWLQQQSPAAARRASSLIARALRDLSLFPNSGRHLEGVWREKPVRFGQYGFVLRYRVLPDSVEINRIFHSAQRR